MATKKNESEKKEPVRKYKQAVVGKVNVDLGGRVTLDMKTLPGMVNKEKERRAKVEKAREAANG